MARGPSAGGKVSPTSPQTKSFAVNSWTKPFSSWGGVAQTAVALSEFGRVVEEFNQLANWDKLQSQLSGFSKKKEKKEVKKKQILLFYYNSFLLGFIIGKYKGKEFCRAKA